MLQKWINKDLPLLLDMIADSTLRWIANHGIQIAIIFCGAYLVRHFGTKLFSRLLQLTVRDDLYPHKSDRIKRLRTLDSLSGAVLRVGVYFTALILILGEINPSYTTALFASAGLVTVAVGFGAKNVINDFLSGMFIIVENQYRVGDIIQIGDVDGTVQAVTIRTTILRDLNGNIHHVPNGSIVVTTNKTIDVANLNEDIVVGFSTDIALLEHFINHVGKELASDPAYKRHVIKPPYFARVNGFANNGIIIKIFGETSAGQQWVVKGELYRKLIEAFRKNNIELPDQSKSPFLVSHKT